MTSTCGYYEGGKYKSGIRLHQRKRDKSFYIVEDGKRINVAIVNAYGTVVKLERKQTHATAWRRAFI